VRTGDDTRLFGHRTASSGPRATPEERRVVARGVCLCGLWFAGHRYKMVQSGRTAAAVSAAL